MDFEISAAFILPMTVLKVKGDVDFGNADTIGRFVDRTIAVGCTLVAVDLYDVTFIDCSSIGTLVDAKHRLDAASSHLWIHAVSPQVLRMLQLTQTDTTLGLGDLAFAELP